MLCMSTALPFTTDGPELDLVIVLPVTAQLSPSDGRARVAAVDTVQGSRASRTSRPVRLAIQPRTAGTGYWT